MTIATMWSGGIFYYVQKEYVSRYILLRVLDSIMEDVSDNKED